jgi:hypothetical protein
MVLIADYEKTESAQRQASRSYIWKKMYQQKIATPMNILMFAVTKRM